MSATLCHYTINTGRLRRSPCSEVSDDAIAPLRKIVAPKFLTDWRVVPNRPGFACKVTATETTFVASVFADTETAGEIQAPIERIVVCTTENGLEAELLLAGAKPAQPLTVPACLVYVYRTADRNSLSWLGDFERCLAWAWVEHRGCAS